MDVDGSQIETGKPIGQDLAHGIMTLPTLLAINKSNGEHPITDLFNNSYDQKLLAECVRFVQDKDVLEQCYEIAQDYCEMALDSLRKLDSNRYQDSLIELVNCVINRRM